MDFWYQGAARIFGTDFGPIFGLAGFPSGFSALFLSAPEASSGRIVASRVGPCQKTGFIYRTLKKRGVMFVVLAEDTRRIFEESCPFARASSRLLTFPTRASHPRG